MDAGLFRYNSSLRTRSLEETIEIALGLARDLGIVRVTDTTRLDRVGIPVFASIRPDATRGSLCVSAGKGLLPAEAKAGALMEAIELAWAEPRRARIPLVRATPRDLLDGHERPEAVYDLGVFDGRPVDLDAPLDCVEATCITSGAKMLVPAELVLFPMLTSPGCISLTGGSHGNGLCSGNTVEEATVHGLSELIERDVMAFNNARNDSRAIRNATLPDPLRAIAERLENTGFRLLVRHQPNVFELPWVMCTLWEVDAIDGVHTGYGCHPSKGVATTRAIVEAAQGRLTVIHGGRDDLPLHFRRFAGLSPADRRKLFARMAESVASTGDDDDYSQVVDRGDQAIDLATLLATIKAALARAGMTHILRVVYTPADYPVQVVRVIVPGLEVATAGIRQVGRRLKEFRESIKRDPVRRSHPE